jgi:hypothetical protein
VGRNRSFVTPEKIEVWSDTRLVVLDEYSFASADVVVTIGKNARDMVFHYYGGLNMLCSWGISLNLNQLCREPLYSSNKRKDCPAFHNFFNSFIEVDGCHRFKDDAKYGHIMRCFREGTVSTEDIRFINDNCVINDMHAPKSDVPIAVSRNKYRDAVRRLNNAATIISHRT